MTAPGTAGRRNMLNGRVIWGLGRSRIGDAVHACVADQNATRDNSPMKLLIIDDHSIMRAGLAALLVQAGADIQVLQAGDAPNGIAEIDRHADLDAVFLDLNLPGQDGMSALRDIGQRRPDLPVILLSSSEDPDDVRRGLAAGALGYVPKSASPQTLMSALQLVLSGEVYVPAIMLRAPAEPQDGAFVRGPNGHPLTERQVDVLRLLSRGLSNKEIGRELAIAERTIKAHVTAIFKSLGVVNRTQAVEAARRATLI